MCVSLGLKKPGYFTVSEGHEYPLVLYINSCSSSVRPSDTTILCFNSPTESARAVGQFRVLIRWQNRPGQSDGRTEGQLVGWTDFRRRAFFSEEGHGFYFFIVLKQIDRQMNQGFTFFVFFFLTFERGKRTWVYSFFFQRTGTSFIFSFFKNKLRKENGV